jgi:hypothetical protein
MEMERKETNMSRNINVPSSVTLTKGQEKALQYIASSLADQGDQQAAGHEVVITINVQGTDYGNVWIDVKQDIPTLSECNMLRSLTRRDSWFISVGPRGAMIARSVPNYALNLKKVGKIKIDLT